MVTLTYQERFKTLKGVFDSFTNRTLFELQSKKAFDELLSPVSVGKESNVFIAERKEKKVIVKIYRIQNCDFKRMYEYIRTDPRYEFLKKHRRKIILAWAQREYKNLIKAEKAGIKVPKVLAWKNHIIVEEMVGERTPAPVLKDFYPDYPYQFLEDIITEMRKLYQNGLVHGDLSAFNIINFNEEPFLIDFSQATLVRDHNSGDLLKRDLKNILNFFSNKLHLQTNFEETFKKIVKEK